MKNGILLFVGIFLTLAFSWGILIFFNAMHPRYGQLGAYEDEITGDYFPATTAGLAERGRAVYADLGCVACHTQQVRRPGFGADTERGWGDRQSVARDYVGKERVHLGTIRIGPDLRNVGDRPVPEAWSGLSWEQYHHLHLYDPRATVDGSVMPSFSFLYQKRRIVGQPSPSALPVRVEPGYELVPTERAVALVGYLRSLRLDYELPEAVPPAAAEDE
jgi:cytochrome c oxidase cbb3-type subunit II